MALISFYLFFFFFFQAEDGIRDVAVTGVQTCALPISHARRKRDEQIEQFTARQTAGLVPPDARRVCRIEDVHVDAEEDVIRAAGDFSDPGECPLRSAAAHRARRQLSKSDLVSMKRFDDGKLKLRVPTCTHRRWSELPDSELPDSGRSAP